jgi:hypothetical protein
MHMNLSNHGTQELPKLAVESRRFTGRRMETKNKKKKVGVRHPDELVSNKEIASLLKVTANTVMNWTKKGTISGVVAGAVYRYHVPTVAKELGIPEAVIDAYFSAAA